jgi:kynurenine formamidase
MSFRQKNIRWDETGLVGKQENNAVVRAASLVKKGIIYPLGTERYAGMPNHPGTPPFSLHTLVSPQGVRNQKAEGAKWIWDTNTNKVNLGFNSDLMIAGMHSGTHVDTLAHATIGEDDHWFNGFSSKDYGIDYGIMKADGSSFLPFFTRGVLLDVAGYLGMDRLPNGRGISADELKATAGKYHLKIEKGDVVLVHTGYADNYPDVDNKSPDYIRAGIDESAARWLAGIGVVAVGSDTESLEQVPCANPDNPHVVHSILLIENGIHIMESVLTKCMVDDKAWEFLFVALPLTVRGATGSMINPIAVV